MNRYRAIPILVVASTLFGFPQTGEVSSAGAQSESVQAAEELIALLNPDQRTRALQAFASEKRTDWHYFPREREGVAIGDLKEEGKDALWKLIALVLSERGVEATQGVLTLEQVLFNIENSDSRNPGAFHAAIWGEPSGENPWGWRFEGHHLSINATFEGSVLVSITPTFLGANPATVGEGQWAGFRNLPGQEDMARELILALGREQREKALQPDEPSDLVSAGAATVEPRLGIGLKAEELGEDQKGLLIELLQVYLENFRDSIRSDVGLDLSRVAGDPELEIQWWGGMSAGEPHAYRICGKAIDIQYATRGEDANHVHTLVRVPGGDFGL